MPKKILCALGVMLGMQHVASADMTNIQQQILQRAEYQKLADKTEWRRLLYYPTFSDATSQQTVHSKVDKPRFFVTQDVDATPKEELEAMLLKLLSAEDARLGNDSVQCRFPARTHWLQTQLNFDVTSANCQKLVAWTQDLNPKQLAVVFAQEYPDSMTSAFAHTLLRVDASTNPASDNYQSSHAINYTVDGNTDDNAGVYAVKSMTGNYPTILTIDPYLPKMQNYLSVDQRDVWTYPLALTQEEVSQITRHIWESKNLALPYYFLTDNCASEILRLIDVVRPNNDLYAQVSRLAIPSEVIRLLNSQGLLKQGEYFPADDTRKQAKINMDGLQDNGLLGQHVNSADNNPVVANNLQRARVAVGQSGSNEYIELGLRASYRDMLDPASGYRQFLDMDAINMNVRLYNQDDSKPEIDEDKKLQLQELTLLRGRSYHPINTARSGGSWGIDVGLKQVIDASVDFSEVDEAYALKQQHLVGNITYEKGVAYAFGQQQPNQQQVSGELPPQLCYAFGAGNVQVGKGLTNGFRVGASANLGCAYTLTNKLRTQLELNVPYWYHSETGLKNHKQSYWQPVATFGLQYDLTKNQGIRIEATHQMSDRVASNDEVAVMYQRYF